MPKLNEVLAKFRAEVPHFVSTDIVHIESGLSLGGESIDPNFNSSLASACYAVVVKSNAQALDLLGLGAQSSEDILISSRDSYLLIRMLGEEHFHGLAITKQSAFGYARSVMKKYEPLLLEAIRELNITGQ
jgi:predicted regulator of Ras-like GTPase activity (Roadblock/LC7/MglB family)